MTSAIVPAHDEAKTVGDIVAVLKASRGVDEVIVVDDGSTDGTAAASAAADRVVRLETNLGKGEALVRGASAAKGDVLFFCDADYVGLTPAHVERILAPVLDGKLKMCTGLRDRGPLVTPVIAHLPLLSGERALTRDVLARVPRRFLQGFRVEMALNYACRANGWAYGSVPTSGVGQVHKMEKVGFWRGLAGYLVMTWQIAEAIIRVRLHRSEFLVPHAIP